VLQRENSEKARVELDRGEMKKCGESLNVTSNSTVGTESEQRLGNCRSDIGELKNCAESLKVTSYITVGTESGQREGKCSIG
jgi:hypothetical protein